MSMGEEKFIGTRENCGKNRVSPQTAKHQKYEKQVVPYVQHQNGARSQKEQTENRPQQT